VRVEVGGYPDSGVAEPITDDFQVDAGGEHQGRMRMAQSVEAELRPSPSPLPTRDSEFVKPE
jgi:hypothetical protein